LADKYREDDKRIMENGKTLDIEEFYKIENKEIWVGMKEELFRV